MEIKTKTIKLQGNAEYAKVCSRLSEFHKKYPKGKVETKDNFKEGFCIFKAKITPDIDKPERFFTGHSFGNVKGVKSFERLETISVGRALAFAGFLADGEIASAEEMEEFGR